MNFSRRTPDDLSPNPLTEAVERLGAASVINLTESNPTRCGFNYPSDLLRGLEGPGALGYEPEPFGDRKARETLARFLAAQGEAVDPDHILLTASTSEAYSYLFKLFADPGDAFLVPTPGYPLLEHLAALEGVRALPYRLKAEPQWPLDFDSLSGLKDPRVKGLITIQPHNPTGSLLSLPDQNRLETLCRQNQWAVISDEVFQDYVTDRSRGSWVPPGVLSFRLGGLSKSLALP
ncbi:MAG TPA: pyridoxal phosphate-dependent aminotransferase, partial [bacterium]|nr:pyridoxal phosphate-dependent aminotransferase [bacterium]